MQTELILGETVFEILADEWDELAGRGMTATPFQKLAYQQSWWKNLHPQGGELHSIIVRNSADELTGIACLYLTEDDKLRFNGCVEETDYLDLIATAHDANDCWEVILAFMLGEEFPSWHHLELCNVPETSLTRRVLPEIAGRHGLTVVESINEVCPIIDLPQSFEAYLENLESKQRREISRKLRRANGADAELHIVSEEDDLAREVDDFLLLLQKSTFEKRDWLNDGRRALFHETAFAAQQDGTLQLMFLEFEGQKAAALFNFDCAQRIWVYNSGLDPDMFAALSPGVVITAKAIELAIDMGRDEFDFLRGDEVYKYRFGAEDTSIYRLQIVR